MVNRTKLSERASKRGRKEAKEQIAELFSSASHAYLRARLDFLFGYVSGFICVCVKPPTVARFKHLVWFERTATFPYYCGRVCRVAELEIVEDDMRETSVWRRGRGVKLAVTSEVERRRRESR